MRDVSSSSCSSSPRNIHPVVSLLSKSEDPTGCALRHIYKYPWSFCPRAFCERTDERTSEPSRKDVTRRIREVNAFRPRENAIARSQRPELFSTRRAAEPRPEKNVELSPPILRDAINSKGQPTKESAISGKRDDTLSSPSSTRTYSD